MNNHGLYPAGRLREEEKQVVGERLREPEYWRLWVRVGTLRAIPRAMRNPVGGRLQVLLAPNITMTVSGRDLYHFLCFLQSRHLYG